MSTARELLHTYLKTFRDADATLSLFAPDAVIELPYAASIGMPTRVQGIDQIHALHAKVVGIAPTLEFSLPTIFIDTPEQVFAEYTANTRTADGRPFEQLYAAVLTVKDDRIVALREYVDLVKAARAVLPNGTADIPA
jgi:uncharacterized protein